MGDDSHGPGNVRDVCYAACVSDANLLALASPRPWYFDGWDIFTTGPTDYTGGHRLVVPLPKDTFHPSQRVSDFDAELIVRAVNAFVG